MKNLREKAQTRYFWFTRINALSYASLTDAILILYAIRIGAADSFIALIASFFFLTQPLMLIGKHHMAKVGAARTFSLGFKLRNLSALLLILVPFIQNQGFHSLGLFIFALGSFGFFAFRSFAVTAFTPMIADLTLPKNRGKFISKLWINFSLYNFIALIGMVILMSANTSILTFQIITLFGAVTGLIGSEIVRRVPESKEPAESAKQPLRSSIHFLRQKPQLKLLLVVWAMVFGLVLLINPISMVALKRGYGISDNIALIFYIVQITGGIIMSYVNSLSLDHTGPRPMLILYVSSFFVISLLWIFAPAPFALIQVIVIFLFIGGCYSGVQTSLYLYLISTVPSHHLVGISLLITAASGIFSGLIGSVVGGGLLRLIQSLGASGLMIYKIYFGISLLFILAVLAAAIRLKPIPHKDRRVKDVLNIFFSIKDWRALFVLQKMSEERSEIKEKKIIQKLSGIGSELSENSLMSMMDSPRFLTRMNVLNAISQISFGPKTADRLIEEVRKGEFSSAYTAAQILGDHGIKKAVPVLRKALKSRDIFLKGKSMTALSQLKDEKSFPKIIEMFDKTHNPRLLIQGGLALTFMRKAEYLPILMNKLIRNDLPNLVRDEMLFSLTDMCGVGDQFYTLYPLFKEDAQEAMEQTRHSLDIMKKTDRELYGAFLELLGNWQDRDQRQDRFHRLVLLCEKEKDLNPCVKKLLGFCQKQEDMEFTDDVKFALILIFIFSVI